MNITEFENKRNEYQIEGTGIDSTTKTELTWTDKTTGIQSYKIPAGERVHLWFSPKKHSNRVFIQHHNEVKLTRLETANNKLTGINKCPGMKTLEKYSDCISKSVTGCRVEPDGYGPDGSPSWLLVVGVI
jgi:hypothetical protein